MTARRLAAVAAIALVSGCRGTHDLAPADVAAYNQVTADVAGQVQTYCSTVAATPSAGGWTASLQEYVNHVRPDLARMAPLAGRLDDEMMGTGSMHAGDMRCAMDAMSRELDRFAGVACTLPDMAANRAEAQRHCDTMQGYADHMRMRGAEAGEMMRSGMMGSGAMNGASDGGWMMPDGGWMGWDHHIAGCPANGG